MSGINKGRSPSPARRFTTSSGSVLNQSEVGLEQHQRVGALQGDNPSFDQPREEAKDGAQYAQDAGSIVNTTTQRYARQGALVDPSKVGGTRSTSEPSRSQFRLESSKANWTDSRLSGNPSMQLAQSTVKDNVGWHQKLKEKNNWKSGILKSRL